MPPIKLEDDAGVTIAMASAPSIDSDKMTLTIINVARGNVRFGFSVSSERKAIS